ncbi:MAG: cache domain-containing protein, partial [Desulfatiglandales bacterium]
MMKNIKLGTKLILAFLVVGILPFAVIGLVSLIKASNALSTQAFGQLEAVRGIKKAQIEKFFAERQGDMGVLVETVNTLRQESFDKLGAVRQIKKNQIESFFNERVGDAKVFASLPFVSEAVRELDTLSKEAKSNGYMGKRLLDYPPYKETFDKYFSFVKGYMETYGYYDVFLFSPNSGRVLLSAALESDFGTELKSEDTHLAKAWQAMKKDKKIRMVDFAPYAPSNGEAAMFIVSPSFSEGRYVGSIGLQVSLDAINAIMQERTGMGKTGEVYLVGPDKLMRSNSFLDPQGHSVKASFAGTVEKNGVDTEASREALSGKEGSDVIMDYNDNPVLSAYAPVKIAGLNWAIIAEIDVAEAFSPVDEEGNEFYAKYKEMYGYYDLFLLNPDGYVFYSVARESDYQTNMVSGKYSSSNLGKLVREVLSTKQYGMADFEPYAPSNGEPAAFIAQPVVHKGDVEIIVALQLPLDAINSVMQQRDGMGKTGETYLVGSDKIMRSDSFLDPTNHSVKASFANPAKGSVDTEAAREALSGRTDQKIIIDYNGNPVLSAYAPLKLGNTTWAMIAEIDEAEAFEAVNTIKWLIGMVAIIGISAIIGVGLLMTRSITKPINRIIE